MYKFDDAHCVSQFLKSETVNTNDIGQLLFVNYNGSGDFVDAKSATFVISPQLKSPMNSDAGCFADAASAQSTAAATNGEIKSWDELYKLMR